MKKLFFFAATAAIALSSCSSDDLAQAPVAGPEVNDGAVSFAAYTARTTRATTITNATLQTGGFGVFAYDQGSKDYATYSSTNSYPNFMFNQKVTSSDGTTWTYEPVKYFNNNAGAKHSFFAYAPHAENVNAVFTLGGVPAIRYNAANGADDIDLLYAQAYKDMYKPGVTHKIEFNFKHALSMVNIYVAPFVNTVHGADHTTGTPTDMDGNTQIIVRSIKFVGTLASQGLLNLETGNWIYENTEESAYELTGAIDVTDKKTDAESNYEHVMTDRMFIPTKGSDKVKIQIVYDVITTDPNAEGTANNSTITNKITSVEEFSLEQGKSYKFYLDLGMTTVKFKADVANWDNETENVDLPNNNHWHPVYPVALSTAITGTTVTEIADASKTGSGVEYITDKNEIHDGGTKVVAASNYVANSKLYTVAATSGEVTVSTPSHVSYGANTYEISDGSTAITSTGTLVSLNVNSKGQIEVGTAGSWVDPQDGKYYTFGGKLYQWRTTGD